MAEFNWLDFLLTRQIQQQLPNRTNLTVVTISIHQSQQTLMFPDL